jgi:glycogen debranching enzyme
MNHDWEHWKNKVGQLLTHNRFEVRGHRYTAPSLKVPKEYEEQFLWDSCFHALAWRWIDPKMAQDELLALVSHQLNQGADAGMVPHMTYWHRDGLELWQKTDTSIITQPPLIAFTALEIYQTAPDLGFLQTLYPKLCAYHDWFERRRDPDGDHLVAMIHPWESGWDASPRWDKPMRLENPSYQTAKDARFKLAQTVTEYGCNAQQLLQDGYFYVEPIEFNAIRAADLEALAAIAYILGKLEESTLWQSKAKAVQAAVQTKLLEPRVGALSGANEEPLGEPSAADFVALFGGCATQKQAAALVEELRSPKWWTRFPIPTSPTDSPLFNPNVYWRGNVYLSVSYLIYCGLRRYGYEDEARELTNTSLELIAHSGFYEFYNPLTGAGLGASPQSWSGVVLDMLAGQSKVGH